MSSKSKVGKAATLLLFRKGWGAIINIGVLAVLARYLNKEDFGLVAISQVFITFISVVAVTGIGEFIIYFKGDDEHEVRNKAFTLNLAITLVISLLLMIAIPFWGRLYQDERIKWIGYLLVINFIGEMVAIVPKAILRKEFNYGLLVRYLTISGTLTSVAKILFVFLNFGVYSLVVPMAIFTPLLGVLLIVKCKLKVDLKIGRTLFLKIINYSKHITGSNILNFFTNQGDNLIVGKVLGLEALGVYNIAFNVSNMVQSNILPIITDISLPSFAKVSNDLAALRQQYLKMINFIAFFSFPILSLMIIHSRTLINVLYGHKWDAAIIPLMILLVFTIMRSVSSPTSGLFYATGNPKMAFTFTLYFTPLFLLSIYLGSYWGLIGVCVTVTLTRVLGAQFLISKSLRLIGYKLGSLYKDISPIIIACGLIIVSNVALYFILRYNLYLDIVIAILQLAALFLILRLFFINYLVKIVTDLIAIAPRLKFLKKILVLNA